MRSYPPSSYPAPQYPPQARVQVRWWTLPSSSISSSKTANTPFNSDRLPTAFSKVRAPRYVRNRLLDEALHLACIRHIRCNRQRATAAQLYFLGGLVQVLLISSGEYDGAAFSREKSCNRFTDAPACPSDKNGFLL